MSGQTKFLIALGLLFVLGNYTAGELKVQQPTEVTNEE